MTEQSSQDQPMCSTAPAQTPDTLRIDLLRIDPVDVSFTIYRCLIQITKQHWDFIRDNLVTADLAAVLVNSCMDIVQTLAQTILYVVMPQVYRYRRTCGTFSPTVLCLTEDQIHAYVGDSIQQALADTLRLPVQILGHTTVFTEMLVRHISKTVNSVLALSTQTSTLESRVPVFFVSGCLPSFPDFKNMVCQIATILTASLNPQEVTEAQSSQTAFCGHYNLLELETPIFCFSTRNDLKEYMETYITHMVTVLKSRAFMPHRKSGMSSSNQRDVCIIVGSDTQILTMEDIKAHGQSAMSSCSGLDVIPGAVPDNDDTGSPSETYPFNSVTVIGTTYHHPCLVLDEAETINNIADELVQVLHGGDQLGAAETDSCQGSVNGGLVVVHCPKLKELTDRIFNLVMSDQDYQVPCLPDGMRMCDTVTYSKLRRGGDTNAGIVPKALYMRTEEVVSRCAVQALFWEIHSMHSDSLSDHLSKDSQPELVAVLERSAGDFRIVPREIPLRQHYSNSTHENIPELSEPMQSQLLADIVHTSMLSVLIGELLVRIGIRDSKMIFKASKVMVVRLADPKMYEHFDAFFMGQSYKDICQTAMNDLLLEFGSLEVMQEAVRAQDPYFEEAFFRVLTKQLRCPTPPVPCGNTAKTTTCSFFKKFKRLCCKKTCKGSKTPTVSSPTCDQDNDKLPEHLNEEELLKDQTEQTLMSRIASSNRPMCSSLRKMFSSIARTLARSFIACCCPESQESSSTDGTVNL